jgi:hypothetical protein
VHEEERIPQVGARLLAEPADHLHPAIRVLAVNEQLAAQVVIQVHLVPWLGQAGQALRDGGHPDGVGMVIEEELGSEGVVVEEQEALLRGGPGIRSKTG